MAMTATELWNRLPWWTKRLLVLLDIVVNRRLGGRWGETVTERLAHARDKGAWEGRVGCALLDRIDPGHCDRALL